MAPPEGVVVATPTGIMGFFACEFASLFQRGHVLKQCLRNEMAALAPVLTCDVAESHR